MITIEQVPLWAIARGGIGHIVLSSDTRWTRTACGIWGTLALDPKPPRRICKECRAALARLEPQKKEP